MFSDNTVVNSPTSPDHQDIFDGVPGLKKKSFDDDKDGGKGQVFPGHPQNRATSGTSSQQSNVPSTILTSTEIEDPFVAVQSASIPGYASSKLFTEPFEQNDVHSHSRSKKVDVSSGSSGDIFDSIDPNVTMVKSKPLFSSGVNNEEKDGTHLRTSPHWTHNSGVREPTGKSSGKISENPLLKKVVANNFGESHQSPSVSVVSHQAFTQNDSHKSTSFTETTSHMGMSPKFEDNSEAADDVWLTVSEVTLTTFPTRAPPPSRPPRPPPRSQQIRKEVRGSSVQSKITSGFSSFYHSSKSYWRSRSVTDPVKSSGVSSINGFEDFAMGRPQSNADEQGVVISNEVTANLAAEASAAAMKEAMDRAEIKFKLSREVRDRENAVKRNGPQWDRDERVMQDIQEQDLREKQEILDKEQEPRERDEEERELRKREKEREHALEIERERERGRQAVDRATKEARKRATVEARQKAERATIDKVNAEAREQAAVQEAQTEARERAATLARERAEKAASDAMERKSAEDKENAAATLARAEMDARIRADRASVNKATAEARQRAAFSAAASAAAAAASATRGNQPKNENDLDSFFNTGVRSDSTSRPSSSDSAFEAQLHNKPGAEGSQQSFTGNSSGVRKSSTTIDDPTSIFGANSSFGDFQEMGGETDERRKTRLERHQRTQERTEKALADKNERDRHTQWEQSERQRIGESLDFEIKRWSAGKEGNLRALLSTLQYVLWPECGWQAVSLTDLITPASVKKVYRKANLCVHPDKLQQKGANLQQKYIAEKVFDLLQEAWTKLNSEELL